MARPLYHPRLDVLTPPCGLLRRTAFACVLVVLAVNGVTTAYDGQKDPAGDKSEHDPNATIRRIRIERAMLFAGNLARRKFDDAVQHFDAELGRALNKEQLAIAWVEAQRKAGPFRSFGNPHTGQSEDAREVLIPVRFARLNQTFKIDFDDLNRISDFRIVGEDPSAAYTPPPYDRRKRYFEHDVEFGKLPWVVKGKITLPRIQGQVPIVVLVHGSGPLDQDETIGPNKPFRDLAVGLSSNGIAVLRYQKRTFSYAKELEKRTDVGLREEVIDDALAALACARSRIGIDKKRVFLLGHSMGASLGPHIAAEDGHLAGLILMSGAPRDAFDVLLDQLAYISSLPGASQDQNKKVAESALKTIQSIRGGADPSKLEILGVPAAYWLELSRLSEQSLEAAAGLHCRVLVMGGGRDYQVTRTDFDLYRGALSERKNITFQWFDEMNHLFMRGAEKARPEEYWQPGHVDDRVIEYLVRWINGE